MTDVESRKTNAMKYDRVLAASLSTSSVRLSKYQPRFT